MFRVVRYDNRLLIAYYLDGKFTNPINVSPVLKRTIYGKRKMYVWRFAFTQEILEVIRVQKEAGTFSASWFGIWNTRKYSGEEPVVWTPKWYWQDYAFADDSFPMKIWQPSSRVNTPTGVPM